MCRILFVFLCFACGTGIVEAQNIQPQDVQGGTVTRFPYFEAKILFGTVLPHHSSIKYVNESYQKGVAVHYMMIPRKTTIYDKIWKYPVYGVGVRHITMGNAEKLGNLSMLYMIFDRDIFPSGLYYQIQTGLAYAHKSMKKSLYNTAVSSPLSFFAAINCGVQFYIPKFSIVRLGFELQHISNGKTVTPNLGFNSLLLTASCMIGVSHHGQELQTYYSKPPVNNHRINFIAAGFFKTDDFVTEKKYFTSVFSAEYEWLNKKYWWGLQAGGDYFYDRSIAALKPAPSSWSEHKRLMDVGIHAGAFVKYSHVVLLLHMGTYIGSNTQNADFFTRVGLRYEWQRLFANVSLRAHGATAQSVEMGIGYKIRFQKRDGKTQD